MVGIELECDNCGNYGVMQSLECDNCGNFVVIQPKGHGKKFEEIVVQYQPAELCMYPEYKGKPYFSIKYEENGKHIIGYGTYDPEVLSGYLRDYFITPTIEADKDVENDIDKPCKNMMKNDYIFNRVSITNVKKSYPSIKGRDYE